MQILDCDQQSLAWFRARMGMPTASEFDKVLAKGRGGAESKTRRTYMAKLAGEILTGEPMDSFESFHMKRGKEMEAEARNYYAFMTDIEPEPVGFIVNGTKGCSPDALLGADGVLELKTTLPHLLVAALSADEFPPEHVAQCQGQLWVAEREWVDLAIYWPNMPMFIKRAVRDEPYIKTLSEEVARFNADLQALVEKVRNYNPYQIEKAKK